jgi:hypothetical protein
MTFCVSASKLRRAADIGLLEQLLDQRIAAVVERAVADAARRIHDQLVEQIVVGAERRPRHEVDRRHQVALDLLRAADRRKDVDCRAAPVILHRAFLVHRDRRRARAEAAALDLDLVVDADDAACDRLAAIVDALRVVMIARHRLDALDIGRFVVELLAGLVSSAPCARSAAIFPRATASSPGGASAGISCA